ncbi:MAG: hypothetical protein JO272_09575 [Pseudonocardiales bacterium]|nr:hypothetical protein [Pseudonocardiales bacterium]
MKNDGSLSEDSVSQRADELVEMAERQTGEQAVRKVVQHHFDQVLALRESHPLDNKDLLSRAIEKADPYTTRPPEVARLHTKMGTIIEGVASAIESQGYKDKAAALDAMRLGYNEPSQLHGRHVCYSAATSRRHTALRGRRDLHLLHCYDLGAQYL